VREKRILSEYTYSFRLAVETLVLSVPCHIKEKIIELLNTKGIIYKQLYLTVEGRFLNNIKVRSWGNENLYKLRV
jgi:hypothetical protein